MGKRGRRPTLAEWLALRPAQDDVPMVELIAFYNRWVQEGDEHRMAVASAIVKGKGKVNDLPAPKPKAKAAAKAADSDSDSSSSAPTQ